MLNYTVHLRGPGCAPKLGAAGSLGCMIGAALRGIMLVGACGRISRSQSVMHICIYSVAMA